MYRFSKLTLIDLLMVTFIFAASWMAVDLLLLSNAPMQQHTQSYPLLPMQYHGQMQGQVGTSQPLPDGAVACDTEHALELPMADFIEHMTEQHRKSKAALEQLSENEKHAWSTYQTQQQQTSRRLLIDI
ncbi:MAG: hypothetical protein ACF8OB_02645 [Phycisphaeraceae bacterium JB051]